MPDETMVGERSETEQAHTYAIRQGNPRPLHGRLQPDISGRATWLICRIYVYVYRRTDHSVIHFFSRFTTSLSVKYETVPEGSSSTVQHPCFDSTSFPTWPIQRYPIMATLLPWDGAQGTR